MSLRHKKYYAPECVLKPHIQDYTHSIPNTISTHLRGTLLNKFDFCLYNTPLNIH